MKYLKKITAGKGGVSFLADFTNGARTNSHDVSCYFMIMQDKGVEPADLESYIKMGEMVDPGHDWPEIRRIAGTFTTSEGVAA